jgi:hypothetical protein
MGASWTFLERLGSKGIEEEGEVIGNSRSSSNLEPGK